MTQVLKTSDKAKEVRSRPIAVSLSSSPTSSQEKPAIMCRTGSFDGMNGPITVTRELLEGIAKRYNEDRKSPQNKFDYAPILLDHVRETELIMGRIMADLEVKPWVDPATGDEEHALFGTLRIDDSEAQRKIEDGKYAHLSISFDEDSFELFEISFVSVEAARRSILLNKGDKQMATKSLAGLARKQQALAQKVRENRAKRATALSKVAAESVEAEKSLGAILVRIDGLNKSLKAAQLKGKFKQFVKQGKMNPAELAKQDFAKLSLLPADALEVVLSSYDARPVSADMFQYGQGGDTRVKAEMTPEKMREAMKLQRAGKKGVALAEDDGGEADAAKKAAAGEGGEPKEKGDGALDMEEFHKCLAEVSECHGKLSEAIEKVKGLAKMSEHLSEEDKEDEKKEEGLAADVDKETEKQEKEEK